MSKKRVARYGGVGGLVVCSVLVVRQITASSCSTSRQDRLDRLDRLDCGPWMAEPPVWLLNFGRHVVEVTGIVGGGAQLVDGEQFGIHF